MYMGDNFYYDVSLIILPQTYIIYEFSTDTIIQQLPIKQCKTFIDENSHCLFRITDQKSQKAFIFLTPFREQIQQEKTELKFILQSCANKYYSILQVYNDKIILTHQNSSQVSIKASELKLRLFDKKNEIQLNSDKYKICESQAKRYLFTALKTLIFLEVNKYEWQKYGVKNEEIENELKISLSNEESDKADSQSEDTQNLLQSSNNIQSPDMQDNKEQSDDKSDNFALSKDSKATASRGGSKLMQMMAASSNYEDNDHSDNNQGTKATVVAEFSDSSQSQGDFIPQPGTIEQKSSLLTDRQPLRAGGGMSQFLEQQNQQQLYNQEDQQQLISTGNQLNQNYGNDDEQQYGEEVDDDELSLDDEFCNAVSYLRCPIKAYKYMEGKQKFHLVQLFVGREANTKVIQIMWSKNVTKDYSDNQTSPISISNWDNRHMDVVSVKKNLRLDKPEDQPIREACTQIKDFIPKGNQIFELQSKISTRQRLILAIPSDYEQFYDNMKILTSKLEGNQH